jgi:hypothetical protein
MCQPNSAIEDLHACHWSAHFQQLVHDSHCCCILLQQNRTCDTSHLYTGEGLAPRGIKYRVHVDGAGHVSGAAWCKLACFSVVTVHHGVVVSEADWCLHKIQHESLDNLAAAPECACVHCFGLAWHIGLSRIGSDKEVHVALYLQKLSSKSP